MGLHLRASAPQVFSMVSLLLIAITVVATSLTQSSFFRGAIIERESSILRDTIDALVLQHEREGELSSAHLEHYTEPGPRRHLERSFDTLTRLSGVGRVKVFNRDGTIAWSDQPSLIGTKASGHHVRLAGAFAGEPQAVFIPADRALNAVLGLPQVPLVEFYLPFSLSDHDGAANLASGVVSIYRSPEQLNETLTQGMLLVWAVTGLGGLVLYAALYGLFRSVYRARVNAESQFAKLSAEHESIIQVEKLSMVGQMVIEIAHQLNNPLVGVINLAELAERDLENKQRAAELLGEVRKAGEHCRDFVQRMLRFNEVARSEPRPVEMNTLLRETITLFRQSVSGHPDVTLDAPEHQVIAEVDPVLIRHAFFNLLHNASQAGPGAPVSVTLSPDERKGARGCRVIVADRGPGIKPEIAAKLFTPFFSTKAGGTGLGLTIAQHIAVRHGGSIHGESAPEGGARFTIWLPERRELDGIANFAG